jgi:hypothetical protein
MGRPTVAYEFPPLTPWLWSAPPEASEPPTVRYAGFWRRWLALSPGELYGGPSVTLMLASGGVVFGIAPAAGTARGDFVSRPPWSILSCCVDVQRPRQL